MQQTFVLRFKNLTQSGKNKSHKAAKLAHKAAKLAHKVAKLAYKTAKLANKIASLLQKFVLRAQNCCWKNSILTQLLAHCADLSKSEGQLCCCHETGLIFVLRGEAN